jgi:hypothetical protein
MTSRHTSTFPRHDCARTMQQATSPSKKQRAQGKPGARCTRSLACEVKKHTSIVTTGSPDRPGLPCAMVLTAYSALSPVTGLFCHRRWWVTSTNLTPASGCQDHTTSPSAASISRPRDNRSRPTLPRPLHPVPNVRDDRDTPLMWDGTARMYNGFDFGKTEIFFRSGLDKAETQAVTDLPVGQNQGKILCFGIETGTFYGALSQRSYF